MIKAFLESMLGPLRPALDFVFDNPSLITTVLLVWMGIFVAGRLQLGNIERKSTELVVAMSQKLIADKPHITSQGLYKRIYPRWAESLRDWGWFVPHRLDLWPVLVTPETVQHKLPFSPQWIAKALRQNDVRLEELENYGQNIETT